MTPPRPLPEDDCQLPAGALQLERRQGYADRAVIGGMGRLLNQWARRVAAAKAAPDLRTKLQRLAAQAQRYERLSPEERRALLEAAEALAQQWAAATTTSPPALPAAEGPVVWDSPLCALPGIGPARFAELSAAGLVTVGDLLAYYPFRYEDRSELTAVRDLQHRQNAFLLVEVCGPGELLYRHRQRLAVVPAQDETGLVRLTWFNQPYRASQLTPGTRLLVSGSVRLHRGEASLAVSEAEIVREESLSAGRIVPVYSAPPFSQVMQRKLVRAALDACTAYPEDRVPAACVARRGLLSLAEAYREVHFPASHETLAAARARLAYDELFALQVRLAGRRQLSRQQATGEGWPVGDTLKQLRPALPFALTGAQERVIGEVLADLARPEPASRLIHGDVGSGKTVVAAAALLAAAGAGQQAALMAPTELLAAQHHRTLTALLEPLGVTPALLLGSHSAAERRPVVSSLAEGAQAVVVGTHALFQQGVQFARLGAVVVDEQHRFGVRQRALLLAKGQQPHCFIMSATPIPRTLALTAYGDFDVSVLDELPPGRRPVHTELLTRRELRRAYQLICDAAAQGQQSYLVCPVIEESRQAHLAAAESLFADLRALVPHLRLGLVHGRLETGEREQVMGEFHAGALDCLVATTVIEVGVDVPNATVMVVVNAERFGLAQLHQLRGRVARSSRPATCVLITASRQAEVIERLQVLERTSDGFKVAEEDLRRRGPGELAGWRQSGLPDLRLADLLADTPTLAHARADAFALVAADPHLAQPQHQGLRRSLGSDHGPGWVL